ncbi:MAG: TolC family protein [Nitrospiraceae bacterium]
MQISFIPVILGVALSAVLPACTGYQALPLSSDAAGETPDMTRIRIAAQEIHHPILKPLDFDDRDGLSPDEAAVLAVLANPGLRAVRDQRAIAAGQVLQAGILPNPRLTYFLSIPTGTVPVGTVTEFGGTLLWDLQTLINRGARVEAAEARAVAVDLDVAWQEWQVAQAAKLAAYRLWTLQSQAQLATELSDLLTGNVTQMRQALQRGILTGLELSAAESAHNNARTNMLELEKQVRQQQLALNRLVGLPPDRAIPLEHSIELPARLVPHTLEWCLEGLEDRRLDLVALRQGYASQEATVRAAILSQFSNISIGFYDVRDLGNFYRPGPQISADLPIFNRNQGNIAIERATRQKLLDEYTNRVFQTRNDIARLLVTIHWLNDQVATAQAGKPILQKLVVTLREALRQGQATVVLYYSALINLTAKQIQILTYQQQLIDTLIMLEVETGYYRIQDIQPTLSRLPIQEKIIP